jgi:hypothetical protein
VLTIWWRLNLSTRSMDNLKVILAGVVSAIKSAYTDTRYSREIYDAAAQFWKNGSRGGFTTRMNATIKFGLTSAFEQGADSVGVSKEDFEQADLDYLAEIISEEQSHVGDLLDYLDGLANDPQAKLSDANYRLDMWANRFTDVFHRAVIAFGKKTRLVWKLGATEKHCESCARLNNIVAWAQEWEQAQIAPQSQVLACHGYNCDCALEQTTKRRTPKALHRIMEIVEATHA